MLKKILFTGLVLAAALFAIGLAMGGPAKAGSFITGNDIKNGSVMYKDLNRGDVRLRIDGNTRGVEQLELENRLLIERVERLEQLVEEEG